jgi:transposase
MEEVTIIGVDLAKNVFQLHGAAGDGSAVFRKKLSRSQLRNFMAAQPPCTVAMEACSGAHHWAREITSFGHDVRLIAPCYVKPFVKRQKNDAADAEAIVEAAQRPNMRFVEPKSEDQQARAILFRAREQFVNQRTESINALRSHLSEFGHVAPQGIDHLRRLRTVVEDSATELPELAREMCAELLCHIERLSERIHALTRRITIMARDHPPSRRLQTMPGVGPLTAMAVEAFAPPMQAFRRGRDFAAWLGLVPRQNSSGGKQRVGRVSKRGQNDIRRLLVAGAMSAILAATRRGAPPEGWLGGMLARKPRKLVAIALANKMARMIWAMLTRNESYRAPAPAKAA